MFVSKKHLSRRTVLRGLGVSMSLPLLDAMIPAGTALAQTAAAPKPKLGFFYLPHGAVMDRWRPVATGRAFDLPQILEPFAPFKADMTIVSGLRNQAAEGAGVHSVNPGTWLSCSSPLWPKTDDPERGISADQIAARTIGADAPFPSLELCTEVKPGSGQACSPEFGCGFGSTISFRAARQPLPMEHNPRKLFYRLFGQGDTAAEREAIAAQTDSLLDLVNDEASSLRGKLGPADQARMAEYLGLGPRDRASGAEDGGPGFLEARSARRAGRRAAGIRRAHQPDVRSRRARVSGRAHADRVTFMMAAEISMLTYNQVGISEAFHPLSHHQNNPDKLARLAVVQTYHSTVFARFLEKLQRTPDGDGSLLDHAILLYGSNMSDSNLHNANPLPSVVFGRGYGALAGGQHLEFAADTPHANLILTLLARAGVPVESLGNSTGDLAAV